MTQEELREQCAVAMATMKARIREGNGSPILFMRAADTRFVQLQFPAHIQEAFREGAMNSGEWKRIFFNKVREIVQVASAVATIFVSDVWMAKSTKEGARHREEWEQAVDSGFETLVKRGWATRASMIQATGQTAEFVCMVNHEYKRTATGKLRWVGDAEAIFVPQSEFSGRQKMFGDLRLENLGEPAAVLRRLRDVI